VRKLVIAIIAILAIVTFIRASLPTGRTDGGEQQARLEIMQPD